jgi:hypothetical protein
MVNKIKDFIFGSGALKKAAGTEMPNNAPGSQPVSSDTSYIQKVVNERMKETMSSKPNPLATEIQKAAPKKIVKKPMSYQLPPKK